MVEFLEEVKDVLKDQRVYDVKTPAPFLPEGQEVSTDGVVEAAPTEEEIRAGEDAMAAASEEQECPQCGGTGEAREGNFGVDDDDEDTDCYDCDGTGYVTVPSEQVSGVEKSEERQAVEADLATLNSTQRAIYDSLRHQRYSHEQALSEAREDQREFVGEIVDAQTDQVDEESRLVVPEHGTGLFGRLALRDWATVNPSLAADLADASLGHKEVARKYSEITTESSVRRYRKGL